MNEEDGEKMNHEGGGGARSYTAMLPTKHRIIFSWAVALNSVGNVRWYFLNFPLKFENPSRFSKSVAHPSINRCQSTSALNLPLPSVNVLTDLAVWQSHALEFAPSVGDSVGKHIGDCGMGWNFFLQLSVKYRRDICCRYHSRWLWQML